MALGRKKQKLHRAYFLAELAFRTSQSAKAPVLVVDLHEVSESKLDNASDGLSHIHSDFCIQSFVEAQMSCFQEKTAPV